MASGYASARMCGRYALKASNLDLRNELHLDEGPQLQARFNIAPMQAAPVVLDAAPRVLTIAQWGLLPSWAKDVKIAHQLVNARVETLAEKAAFKGAHRCLVPCDGFYEWRHESTQRVPHFVQSTTGRVMTMAGLWSRWRSPDGLEVDTFTIITTAATDQLATLHDRMPVFIDADQRGAWLTGETPRPSAETFEITQVSPQVNSVSVDDASCLAPATTVQLRLL